MLAFLWGDGEFSLWPHDPLMQARYNTCEFYVSFCASHQVSCESKTFLHKERCYSMFWLSLSSIMLTETVENKGSARFPGAAGDPEEHGSLADEHNDA